MRINSNVGLRDRSRITLGGFKGLDTLSAAVDVSAIHATEMKNLISRDGVNHKRFGWKTQLRIRDNCQYLKIQGIFDFTIYGERFLIVYAGKRFWSVDILNNYQDITESATTIAVIDKTILRDTECKCYINGNKAYFIGCGDLLVFSKWDNNKFELRRVVGNEDVYIPTTTENIGSEEEGQHYTRITAEERNILSPYTKNLLFGPKELAAGESASYYLDTTGFEDVEVKILKSNEIVKLTIAEEEKAYYHENDVIDMTKITFDKPIKLQSECLGKVKTNSYGTYKYSDNITVNIQDEVPLISMLGGDKLVIRNYLKTRYGRSNYKIVDNVDIYYIAPEKISYKLVYVKANGETTILQTVSEAKVGCTIIGAEVNNSEVVLTAEISYSYDELSCDLSNYSAQISEIHYGNYEDFSATGLAGKDKAGNKYTGQFTSLTGRLVLNAVKDVPDAYAPIVPDVPNIEVKLKTFCDTSILTSAIKACEFGAQGGTDRLFIVDSSGNTVRWSKDNDFTYFGEKSWCVCGNSDKSITGMDRLNDSTLLVAKEYSPKEPSIFIITGNIITGETEAGTVDYTALFTPHGYQVGVGAVGEIANFNGDCLMVAKDGLYAVLLGENMTVDSRCALHRSRQISNKLEKFDLSKAKCVSFNGKFFVAVGGEEQECYVADNKYTASFEGDIQNVVNYEWWRWTNIPVNVWGFVGNELWFGTEDGQLCAFTEDFYDETFSRLRNGLATYVFNKNEIVGFGINKDIKVGVGDIFTPTCDFYGGITTDRFECVNGETRFYLPLNDYFDSETIYINNSAFTITKKDLYFSIQYSTDLTEITFYRNYKNKPLTVMSAMNGVVTSLKDRDDKFPKWSEVKSQGGLNPSNEVFTATLSHKEPVVSQWVSGAMDLGTRAYSKSLTYLVLTGEKDLANRLKYGLKTRFTHRDYELLRANNDLDFSKLDLQTVSMDSDFASSYTKKLNIRNINFLMLYFISDTAEDVALNSVQIEFKLSKRNIGVR